MAKVISEQVVVITGASSGIGLHTARNLASRGARVVLTSRNAKALDQVVLEIEELGGEALAVRGDVTSEKDMRRVVRRAVKRFGRIDTWINNAAVFIQGEVDGITLEEYRRVIDVNLLGYINGTKQVLRQMRKQGEGSIIMISSILAHRAAAFFSAYAASKAGVDGFAEALRVELWGTGIAVSTLYLPTVDTPIYHHARSKFGTVPKPPPIVTDPDRAVNRIVKLVEKPRRTSSFGIMSTVFNTVGRLPHGAGDWIFHVMSQFTRTDIKDPGDNLDKPVKDELQVRGGWMEWGWRGLKPSEVAHAFPLVTLAGALGAGLMIVGIAGERRARTAESGEATGQRRRRKRQAHHEEQGWDRERAQNAQLEPVEPGEAFGAPDQDPGQDPGQGYE